FCGTAAGTYGPMMGDGYYVMLRPLSKGQHTIHFSGTFGPPIGFTLDIVYDITVVNRSEAAAASLASLPLSKLALSRAVQTMRSAPIRTSPRLGDASLAPNPTRNDSQLHFTLSKPGHVEARLYDVNGRTVRVIADRSFGAGAHDLRVDRNAGDPLNPGVYFYRVRTDEGTSEGRMIV